jgi:hypothetical protein
MVPYRSNPPRVVRVVGARRHIEETEPDEKGAARRDS